MIAHKEEVELLVKVLNALLLHVHLVGLHAHQRCFVGRDESRLQQVFLAVGPVFQYVQGQFQHKVAACGIDIRGREHAVGHEPHATFGTGKGVDAA